jgi:3-dehydroquinate synthase
VTATRDGDVRTLEVALGERSYPIRIGAGILGRAGLLQPYLGTGRTFVVTDGNVAPLHLATLRAALDGTEGVAVVPDGEQHKTLAQAAAIIDGLVAHGCGRDATVIALGGGVVGDLAGFAAACYQRGVAWLQAPTTLLAQADASVGGKTAVNHPAGKNLIGAFHQPRLVLCDTSTLRTLDARQFAAGLAEVIKHALIGDAALFGWLEEHLPAVLSRDPDALADVVERSCALKARVVAADEREERGQRALLNLGHTFGHAIEVATGYERWLHGEAVAVGLVLAARLSQRLGMIDAESVARVVRLLQQAGLPISPRALDPPRFIELMRRDKKTRAGRLHFVLLDGIGAARTVPDVPEDALLRVLAERT